MKSRKLPIETRITNHQQELVPAKKSENNFLFEKNKSKSTKCVTDRVKIIATTIGP